MSLAPHIAGTTAKPVVLGSGLPPSTVSGDLHQGASGGWGDMWRSADRPQVDQDRVSFGVKWPFLRSQGYGDDGPTGGLEGVRYAAVRCTQGHSFDWGEDDRLYVLITKEILPMIEVAHYATKWEAIALIVEHGLIPGGGSERQHVYMSIYPPGDEGCSPAFGSSPIAACTSMFGDWWMRSPFGYLVRVPSWHAS